MECRRLLLLALAGLFLSCKPSPERFRGPIVLITAGGLRADVVGPDSREPSWTPRLNELAAPGARGGLEVWAGSAVVASSEPLVSLVSLLCGVRPWQHQLLHGERPVRRRFPTLAQVLAPAGYRGRAHVPSFLHPLLGQGFDVGGPISRESVAEGLENLEARELLWLHFSDAEIGRGRRRRAGAKDPSRRQLLAYADPRTALSEAARERLWEAYGESVTRLDTKVGEVLDVLRRSSLWDRTLLAVTASQGMELGEHGQILFGENLGRETIEVPLLLRWPEGAGALAIPSGSRVSQMGLWTTIAELAGVDVAPVHPPSLFRRSSVPILSELYGKNGVNRFSLVQGDLQLHWTVRFAPAEPRYYLARQAQAGMRSRNLREPLQRIFDRLDEAFGRALALSGPPGTEPELQLELWTEAGVERVDDVAATREMAVLLRRQWMRFVEVERSPEEESALGEGPPSSALTPGRGIE